MKKTKPSETWEETVPHHDLFSRDEVISLLTKARKKERERIMSEIEKIEQLPYYCRLAQNINGIDYCSTCEQAWDECSCSARNSGHKKAIDDVLRLLSPHQK